MRGRKPELNTGNVVPMKNAAGDFMAAPSDPCPDPPMELHGQALDVWHELAPMLHDKGRLRLHHRYQFAVYCNAVAAYFEACATLDMEGTFYTVTGRNGTQHKRHAAFEARRDAAAEMKRGSDEWGLSALAEQRIGGTGQGDLFDRILSAMDDGPD